MPSFFSWLAAQRQSQATPGIVITNLPAYGSTDNLAGVVLGADPAACRVAVFIDVPPYGWYSKPTCAQALTPIQPDGSWSADITTGGMDTNATRIAALLVSTNYDQPCVLGEPFLPTNVFSEAMASAVVTREYPGVRWIGFSGYDWWVKASSGTNQLGPGPNYFSDSTNNVWTDAQGWLHLRITNRSNQWQCAEIVSARTFGYGSYRFELGSRVDDLDTNIVLGLFTWSDDPAYADREMDVECSRGFAADANNAQFTVQPYNLSGHYSRYQVPAGLADSTHLFTWQSNSVSFQCQSGSYSPNPNPTNVLGDWIFANASAVPRTGDENVRINLWLLFGHPPIGRPGSGIGHQKFPVCAAGFAAAGIAYRPRRAAERTSPVQYQRRAGSPIPGAGVRKFAQLAGPRHRPGDQQFRAVSRQQPGRLRPTVLSGGDAALKKSEMLRWI